MGFKEFLKKYKVYKYTKLETVNRVIGYEDVKQELNECFDFLINPTKYKLMGVKLPRGILLSGPPGTGKTMIVREMANSCNIPFNKVDITKFNDLFAKPIQISKEGINFIDEIDSFAQKRGSYYTRNYEAILNKLLVEMDGFQSNEKCLFIATTNRIETLDRALLRAGRFERIVKMDLPDYVTRVAIAQEYLRNIVTNIDKDELSKKIGSETVGLSPAEIGNICNEAGIICVREDETSVNINHVNEAISRAYVGIKTDYKFDPETQRIIAYHEAGHAVVGWFLKNCFPVQKVTILPRGDALGYAQFLPADISLLNEDQFFDNMCATLGGRISEEIFFESVTSGAIDDLQKVTRSAYEQIVTLGFNKKIGKLSFDAPLDTTWMYNKPYSEEMAKIIDEEVRKLISRAHQHTTELLLSKKEMVEKLAERLIDKKDIFTADMVEVLGERPFKVELNEQAYL